ncbi:MAG: hypothetical protein M0Z87_03595 [Actinomycetota bacterium]|nr:hypothetical protein [Actinomycetota bacterium]
MSALLWVVLAVSLVTAGAAVTVGVSVTRLSARVAETRALVAELLVETAPLAAQVRALDEAVEATASAAERLDGASRMATVAVAGPLVKMAAARAGTTTALRRLRRRQEA